MKSIISIKSAQCVIVKNQDFSKTRSQWIIEHFGDNNSISKIPISDDILFQKYNMNEIVNKILLQADQFMTEIFTKQKARIQEIL